MNQTFHGFRAHTPLQHISTLLPKGHGFRDLPYSISISCCHWDRWFLSVFVSCHINSGLSAIWACLKQQEQSLRASTGTAHCPSHLLPSTNGHTHQEKTGKHLSPDMSSKCLVFLCNTSWSCSLVMFQKAICQVYFFWRYRHYIPHLPH